MEEIQKYEALIADLAHNLYRKTHLYDFEDLFQIGLASAMHEKFAPNQFVPKRFIFFSLCICSDMFFFV